MLTAFEVNPTSAQGQRVARGTVRLSAAAPAGGAVIGLHSSHNDTARMAETVTIAAGQDSLSFDVTTATVTTQQAVTLTASYAGVSKQTTLTVTPPPLVASFTVTSPTQGTDSCRIIEAGAELDCTFDARSSSGFVQVYVWTYSLGTDSNTHQTRDSVTRPEVTGGCDFFDSAGQSRDASGNKYLEMTVTLQLQDAAGARGQATIKQVRVYPDSRCGYDF